MQGSRFRSAVHRRNVNDNVVGVRLGVLGKDIEIPVAFKDAGVEKFELGMLPPAPAAFLGQPRIRELRLRIFVERLHVGVSRSRVEIEVALLYILSMIAFRSRETEKPLFQNRIPSVPQRQREA